MSIQERILQVLDLKSITPYRFCKDLELSQGYLDKRGAIGTDKYLKIIEYFPEINPNWLLTGKGDMILDQYKAFAKMEQVTKGARKMQDVTAAAHKMEQLTAVVERLSPSLPKLGVPLIPIEAMAGFGAGSQQVMEYDTNQYIVPEFSELKVDYLIRVKGSSMYPKYNSGDIVACKKLELSNMFFQWNKVYVLDTEQGALIKRVCKASDPEHVLLVSDNEKYEPFDLHLSKINAIALVVGVIRLE